MFKNPGPLKVEPEKPYKPVELPPELKKPPKPKRVYDGNRVKSMRSIDSPEYRKHKWFQEFRTQKLNEWGKIELWMRRCVFYATKCPTCGPQIIKFIEERVWEEEDLNPPQN